MPKFAANLTMLFKEFPFLRRFQAAKDAGFQYVEVLFPYGFDPREVADAIKGNRLELVLFDFPPGNWDKGDRGIACLPERVKEFRGSVDQAVEYAIALGCTRLNCLAGIAPEEADQEELRRTFVSNLRYAARKLDEYGIQLLIEPISTHAFPGFYLNNTAQAVSIIEEIGAPNLWLQYDLYHMTRMGDGPHTTLPNNLQRIAHVQVAGPQRTEMGIERFIPLFSFMDNRGYRGSVGLEFNPSTTTKDALDYLLPLLFLKNSKI